MQLNAGLWPFVTIAKQSELENAAPTKMCLVTVPEYLCISNHRFVRCAHWMPKLDCDISRFAMAMPAGVIPHFPPVQWACYVRRIDWLALVNGARQPPTGRARARNLIEWCVYAAKEEPIKHEMFYGARAFSTHRFAIVYHSSLLPILRRRKLVSFVAATLIYDANPSQTMKLQAFIIT